MASQPPGSGDDPPRKRDKTGSRQIGREANPQLSNPPTPANPFVAFHAGGSQEDRRAVRVQAAKASAAARKATIAKKQAQQKKETVQSAEFQASTPQSYQAPITQDAQAGAGRGKRKRSSPQPGDWRLQTGRFRGSGHVNTARTQRKASPEADEEVVRLPDEQRAPSYFGQLTPPQPQLGHSTTTFRQWQQFLQPEDGSRTLAEPYPSPSRSSQAEQTTSKTATTEIELPLTPVSIASIPSPTRIGLGRADPFNCYPVPYHPIYDGLLHHMLTIFAPRGWPALKITQQEGLDWEHFMTQHALAEPALFFVRLLFASGDMIRLGALKPEVSLWLQAEAIKTINGALACPDRAVSDGLILAVGRIALHECMYGDRKAANLMHRPAQRRMIDMRGGMNTLPFPMLVKRLMRWADRVMSTQGGTERFLPDDEDQDNSSFTTAQSVNVLEEWVPSEGRALRKKIAISDLLTD